ncbi:malonate--CoA ligase-like [Amborella trichopoda]|uniref:malonate--CoA ligase-like n=1 Tax=Amborella trichopoda TaxID=13333 RepID=UPI0009C03A60|nr:malonate--CoA ligase-like [Amborella trichopoda]|eukprot:XP_020518244.1 malonate--CoA ligase-like [Amborella trichopoda]
MEVVKAIAKQATAEHDRAALRFDMKTHSYGQLISATWQMLQELEAATTKSFQSEGVVGGKWSLGGARVGILAKPSAEFVAGVLATWFGGGVVIPLAVNYPEAELSLITPLYVGAVVDFLPKFSVRGIWHKLRESYPKDGNAVIGGTITVFTGVPTMYTRLLQGYEAMDPETQAASSYAARQLRLMMCGSAALPYPLMKQWESITGHWLLDRYGMTEFGVALSNPLKGVRKAGTVGLPLPGVQVSSKSKLGCFQHPDVAECSVLGLSDEDYGQVVCAVIVPEASARERAKQESRPAMTLEELQAWAKDKLAPYKIPTKLFVFDAFKRNHMGKVNKKDLKKELEQLEQ